MEHRGWQPKDGDKKRVVVVGAGVAGMTAAHELVERGYEVEVVEMARDLSQIAISPLVGGMARTSWAAVPTPPDQYPLDPRLPPFTALASDEGPEPFDEPDERRFTTSAMRFVKRMRPGQLLAITVFGPNKAQPLQALIKLCKKPELKALQPWWTFVRGTSKKLLKVRFSVRSTRVPGEHGFRFFPSFYRHMFETMKRIPIQEASSTVSPFSNVRLSSDSARTVFDALRSADDMELGLASDPSGPRSFKIERRPQRTLMQIREVLANVLERAGYRGADVYRFATRYLVYLTSSRERRCAEYEQTSWEDFLGLRSSQYSDYFVEHVNSGAQALVAMSSHRNDARTLGSIAVQLALDQLRSNRSGYTDATLRGPTSLALFAPWRAYLESQRVKFTSGQLVGFTGVGMAVRPVFARCDDDKDTKREPHADHKKLTPLDIQPADYFVITIPVDRFQALFADDGAPSVRMPRAGLLSRQALLKANERCLELDVLDGRQPDVPPLQRDDLHKYLTFEINDFKAHPDAGPFRYMSGIQFFFKADVEVFLGHSVGLDSPWGVSYISQAQYWQARDRGQSGSRGVLSAIFTRFEELAPGFRDPIPRTAQDCDADGIADRVWKQIFDTWDAGANGPLPEPMYYFLDENLRRVDGKWENQTPYLVNHVHHWDTRGGARRADGDYVYPMQLGHTVFAGAFMRTTTRLNTMEAANESARRATNAILDYDAARCQRSPVYDLEDSEVPELRMARELDARIHARGGRHVLDHPGIEWMLRAFPWDLVRLGLFVGKERP